MQGPLSAVMQETDQSNPLAYAPAPLFGLTQNDRAVQAVVPGARGTSTAFTAPAPAFGTSSALAALTDNAITDDPSQWTPEEAAAQTDRALARIATANPELAQSLAAERGKSEGEDLPWYKDILKGVGDFLHATKLDVAFEVLSRPSHILPEVIHDWGKQDVWTNIGEALTGKSTVSWDDVLADNLGMERNIFTSILGFAGDVATDPLTYLTFGTGGLGRAASSKAVTEAGLVSVLERGTIQTSKGLSDLNPLISLVQSRLPEGYRTMDDVARALLGEADIGKKLTERASAGLVARTRAHLGMVHPDARAGALFSINERATTLGLQEVLSLSDNLFRQASTGGWQRVTADAARTLGVEKGAVDDVLRGWVSEGTGVGVGRAAYQKGKEAAAGLGGWRFRFSIPGFDVRAAGMRLPFIPKRLDFSMGRRMFAGISGQVRLMKMVGDSSATMEDMRIFWEEGFSALKKKSPRVAEQLGRGTRGLFYTTSEGLGKATSKFSAHSQVLRGGGLAAKVAADAAVVGRHIKQQVGDSMQTVILKDGTYLTPDEALKRVVQGTQRANELGADATGRLTDDLNEFRVLVPDPGVSAAEHYDPLIKEVIEANAGKGNLPTIGGAVNPSYSENFDDTLHLLRKRKKRAEELEKSIDEMTGDPDHADLWRSIATNRDFEEMNANIIPDEASDTVAAINDVNPADRARHGSVETYRSDTVPTGGDIGVETLTAAEVAPGVWLHGTQVSLREEGVEYISKAELDELVRDASGGVGAIGMFAGTVPEGSLGYKLMEAQAGRLDKAFEGLSAAEAEEATQMLARLRSDKGVIGAARAPAVEAGEEATRSPAQKMMDDLVASMEVTEAAESRRLVVLSPEESRQLSDPDIALMGPRNDYVQDLRAAPAEGGATEATEAVNRVTEIQGEYQELLRRLHEGEEWPDDIADDVRENVENILLEEGTYGDQLGRLTSRILQSEGYTGVKTITDEGTFVTVFANDAGQIPLARVNPRAARALDIGGSQLRAVTDGARESILGKHGDSGNNIMSRIARSTRNDPRPVAEAKARAILAEHSITLRETIPYYETDPVKVLRSVTDETARKVTKRYLGDAAREAESLGLTRGAFGEGAAGIGRYQFVLNETSLKVVEKMTAEEKKAAKVVTRLADKQIPTMTREYNQLAEVAEEASAALDDLIEYGDARTAGILTTIARRAEEKKYMFDPELIERTMARSTEDLRLADEAVVGPVQASGVTDRPHILWRGENPSIPRKNDGTQEWYKAMFTSHDEEVAARYAGTRGKNQRWELKPGANVLVEGSPEFDELMPNWLDDTRAETLDELVIKAKKAGYDAIQMTDQDGLGTAVLNRQMVRSLRDADDVGEIVKVGENIWRQSFIRPGGTPVLVNKFMYGVRDADGHLTVVGEREIQQVLVKNQAGEWVADETAPWVVGHAMTAPEFRVKPPRGQLTIGDQLLDKHWAEKGVDTHEKMAENIELQTFSGSGGALNQRAVERNAKRLLADARKRSGRLGEEAKQAKARLDRGLIQLQEATNEMNRLTARTQSERAPVLTAMVPAENALNMEGMSKLSIPGFEGFAMPAFMAEEFERAIRGYPKLDGVHAAFRTFNGWWKSMATWLMPGFHIRNFQGAWFNNWLGGVGIRDYITAGRIRMAERELSKNQGAKWSTMRIIDKDVDLAEALHLGEPGGFLMGKPIDELTYGDLASLSGGLNVTASNGRLFAEAQLTVEAAEKRYKGGKGYLGRLPSPYTKAMRGAGTMTENIFRTAALVRGMRDGRSIIESRAFTMMRHGDYEDMTDWEYTFVRDLLPFYKWMRTNTPLQIHQLLESPGKLLAVEKAQRAVFTAYGKDWDEERRKMPEWMQESFVIPKDFGPDGAFNAVMLDLPMSDLFMSGREFISSFLPTVRPFLESYVFEKQTFSGAPIEGKPVPMNPLFSPIAGILDAVGLVEQGPDGAFMSDKTQNLLGIIPLYSRFKNFIYEDPDRVKQRGNILWSAVGGIGLRPVDTETMADTELDFYYNQVLPAVEYLKGIGYKLPTTAELADAGRTSDMVLANLGITPGVAA
jgi:hypothetical protein